MAEAMAATGSTEEAYTGYDTSGYASMQQDWQEQWNWGGESADYTSGDQFCGNVAFFVPFAGMGGMGGMPMTNASASTKDDGDSQTQAKSDPSDLQEMKLKLAKLQAENQRLMQLCETERQMRQIEVTAFQQTLEMYAVPHSEVDQLVRRFQEDTPALNYGMNGMNGMNPLMYASNASTATGSPGTGTGTAASLETLLQDLYNKLYDPQDIPYRAEKHKADHSDKQAFTNKDPWEGSEGHSAFTKEVEEVEKHLGRLESMVEMSVDERARTTLLRMTPEQGKAALAKVEEIIREQGGYCRSLSSMVQSVCRKTGHTK